MEKWQDPIFGYIPDQFQEWYLKESGTYWNSALQEWFVNDKQKANRFQSNMFDARKQVIDNMPDGSYYKIGHTQIFGLMKDMKTELQYDLQGKKYIQKIGF